MTIINWGALGLFLAIVAALALWPSNTCFRLLDTAIAQESSAPSNPFGGDKSTRSNNSQKLSPGAKTKPSAAVPENTSKPAKTASTGHGYSTLKAREIKSALSKPCHLEFIEVPFADVKRDLEDEFGFNIVLDQTAVDDALTDEELVTVRLTGIKLSNALRLMLREFNATYVVSDGVIRIISLENVTDPENLSQKMINVKWLLNQINQTDARLNPNQQDPKQESKASAESLLRETITHLVQRDQWKQGATLDIIGVVLVINGPEGLLDEVSDFLQDLEAKLKVQ